MKNIKVGDFVTVQTVGGPVPEKMMISKITPRPICGPDYFAESVDGHPVRIVLGIDGKWAEFSSH
jgi:hypothetical protein